MGLLVNGEWKDVWYDTAATGGRFERKAASFRQWLDPSPDARFPATAGRYHLYVSYACPWAHRTLIVRALKGLEQAISVSAVDPVMLEQGWTFSPQHPDPIGGAQRLYERYITADPTYTGRVTVPVLWDKQGNTIVSNESSEIIRMLNDSFAVATGPDLYPEALRAEIDRINDRVYTTVNNGVYRAGFASTQDAYEEAVDALFTTLDELESHLAAREYLVGEQLTEADIRLFTTLIRFDPVYHGHFKCNVRRLVDYPRLRAHTQRIYALPGVNATVYLDHITTHYYASHRTINPTGIVPRGPLQWP
ncbi:MAG: glutathione S-transferase family protein [Myxococcales bacterium FL481]|nr:MAG: glutathione S-transferase family protein [Myxococcales bacterium FL481]